MVRVRVHVIVTSRAVHFVRELLKPDTYDGSVSLNEFLIQFKLIARANRWTLEAKTAILISCLRGKARTVLERVSDLENLSYNELKSKLELRFGETNSLQNYYFQFTNRRQKFGEDIASLGSDLERLSQLAYPECSQIIRDKIACAQFVSALSDRFVSRTLQLEGITFLREAIVRAETIKSIQRSNFEQRKKNVNFEGRRKTEITLILVEILIGRREITKKVLKVILKGMKIKKK